MWSRETTDMVLRGEVEIGAGAWIGPNVRLAPGVVVEAGAVVGRVPRRGWTHRDPGPPAETVIGPGTLIGYGAIVYAGVTIGAQCLIGDQTSIREGCILGDRVRLATFVSVNYETTIGDDTQVMQGAHITGRMQIGRGCFFGPLVATANDMDPLAGYDPERVAGATVEDGVLVGAGAVLMPGIRIGKGARVASGAIVTRDVSPGALVRGERAREVG